MESSESTQAIVALEDDAPEVLFEKSLVGDLHFWPVVRIGLARASADNELGTATIRRRQSRAQYLKSLADGLVVPNPRSSRHVPRDLDLLFLVNSRTNNLTPRGYENWLVGDLAAHAPARSAIMQDQPFPRRGKHPQPVFDNTFSEKDLALRVSLLSRNTPVSHESVEQLQRFTREVIDRFDYPVEPSTAARMGAGLLRVTKQLVAYQQVYGRFLDRVRPKTLIMGNASYMNRSPLLPLLRQRGIPVHEPQHGWIGPAHGAYNFGAAFSEPALQAYLPDSLLTFGEFWSESIRHPARRVAIGKASLETAAREERIGFSERDRILLVSSIYRTDELMRLARMLRARLPGSLTVVVRPHPSERLGATATFSEALSVHGIELDDQSDLYRSMAAARVVVGYASTVLFEALPFGVRTFVIGSPLSDLYTPREIFGERLAVDESGVERILEASRAAPGGDSATPVDRVWKPNAIENFTAFLREKDGRPGTD